MRISSYCPECNKQIVPKEIAIQPMEIIVTCPEGHIQTMGFVKSYYRNASSDPPTAKVCDSETAQVEEQSRKDGVKELPDQAILDELGLEMVQCTCCGEGFCLQCDGTGILFRRRSGGEVTLKGGI